MKLARPQRATLACLAALLAAALVLHREVIFRGQVYHMDDAADGYYPGHIAVWRAFTHGELPTWEAGSWCGWPLIVDPYNGVFYPLNVVYYALGAAPGLGFAIVLHMVLGGAGMWLLLRKRRVSVEAALFGAMAFALSSFFAVRARHVIFVQMMAWLPWILLGVEGWLAERRRRDLVVVAATTALALIAGALSIGHFAALGVAIYVVARAVSSSPTSPRRVALDLGALGGAALLGALIAAAQLVPTVAHLPLSPRSLGSDYSFASSYAWPSLRYLVTLLAPDFFGGEDRGRYVGAPNHWELCGWYVGALCVALAPLALLRPRGPQRRGGEIFALLGLVLLAIGLALGDAGPVHPFFFRFMPLYSALRCPARALLMAVLALPILGAHGVDALLERLGPLRSRIPGLALALGLAAVAALVAWTLRPLRGIPLGPELGRAAGLHLTIALAAGAVTLALVLAGLQRRLAALLLVAVLVADLLSINRGYVRPQPADYPAGFERFGAVEWLLKQPGARDDRFVNDPRGPFRLHNVGMVLDLENASGYDSVGIWRYVNLLYLIKSGAPYPEKKLKDDFAGIGVWNLSSKILDLMNVRWLIAENAPDPRWIERFRPTAPTGTPADKHEPMWNAKLRVFESSTVLPRAFVAYRADVVTGGDRPLAARLTAPDFDPGRVVLLEAPLPGVLALVPGEVAPPPTPAKVVGRGRHHLDLEVDAAGPGVLFVSEVHYPGWSATVDGKEVAIARADWTFRAIPVAAGHHRVEMRYRSRPTQLGLLLSLVGLGGLAALGLLRRRRDGGMLAS